MTLAGPLNVLFVEDEADVRLITQLALRVDPDIRLWPFDNGHDALAAAAEPARGFDLALVDANLPGMSGGALILLLRAFDHLRDMPVVLFTALTGPDRQLLEAMPGVVGTIEKPFDVTIIHSQIRAFAGRS